MSEHKLLDEAPLIVLPSLAVAIGLQQAVFLQQLHFNLSFLATTIEKEDPKRRKEKAAENLWTSKGFGLRLWYRKSVAGWIEELPWLSARTLKRTVAEVKNHGVLVTSQGYDQTNYYSIDYDQLRSMGHYGKGQIDPFQRARLALSMGPERPDSAGHNDLNNLKDIENIETIQEPAASGGGKAPARETRERLRCDIVFGFDYDAAWKRYLSENRACSILFREGVRDADLARRILAEWASCGDRGFRGDPAAALISLARNSASLVHTFAGDERMPLWAQP